MPTEQLIDPNRRRGLRALTLWPEWAWAVCYLGKRVENRPRPAEWYGLHDQMEFAIHGGAHLGGRSGLPAAIEGLTAVKRMSEAAGVHKLDAEAYGRNPCLGIPDETGNYHILSFRHYPAQMVVALVTLDRCEWNGGESRVELRDGVRRPTDGWQVPGQYGFFLRDVRVLPRPVRCTVAEYPGNRQGLWTLPEAVEAQVRELAAA
jgi:hypothetical protein